MATKKQEDSIFIGSKPFMNYVTAVVMQFSSNGVEQVVLKARGKFMSKAVDVAEVVKNRFMKDKVDIASITSGSEEFENKEKKQVRVSTLEITLKKK